MKKTTIYLPEDLKAALGRVAASRGRSEAELVREAVRGWFAGPSRPDLVCRFFRVATRRWREGLKKSFTALANDAGPRL